MIISSMCFFHVRSSSICTPRALLLRTCSAGSLSMKICGRSGSALILDLEPKGIYSVLAMLRLSLFAASNCLILTKLRNVSSLVERIYGGGGGTFSYKRPMAMCRCMGSHFDDWIDNNGAAFSIELLEWGRTFSDFEGKKVLFIYGKQTYQNVCTVGEKKSALRSF